MQFQRQSGRQTTSVSSQGYVEACNLPRGACVVNQSIQFTVQGGEPGETQRRSGMKA